MLILGDSVFRGNLGNVASHQKEDRADAAFLVEEVPYEETSRYDVLDTNKYGEVVEVVEKPDDPPSNLVMTGFYMFTPAIFHACHVVQPSERGEYELSDAIDLLIQSGHTIDAIRLDGWRIDVGYPEDRDRAEERLNDRDDDEETTEDNGVDEESVDDYLDISRAPRIDAAREQQHEPVVPRSRPGFMSAPCRVYERFTHVRTGVGSENICTGLTDDADA